MGGLFGGAPDAPAPKPPAPMPDPNSAELRETQRGVIDRAGRRRGRRSTILTRSEDREYDSYSGNSLGSGS